MILNEEKGQGDYQIRAYTPGTITVNTTPYHRSLILTPKRLITDWAPQSLEELTQTHLAAIMAENPKIVILGTGVRFALPKPDQLAPLYRQRIGVECMDTGAACRTYTVLLAEGRLVVAALLIQ